MMTEEQRDNLLLSMFDALNNLDAKFEKKIDNLDEKFERKFERFHGEVELYRQEVKQYCQELEQYRQEDLEKHQELVNELERQRINVAKLENSLINQIKALFDVKEINEDKLKEHSVILEDVDNTLSWHHKRILKLETANN